MTLKLSIFVTYELNGTPRETLRAVLEQATEHVADHGLLSGETAADVLECTHEITEEATE